jgi:predicted S18 family serine protease
MKPSHAVLAAVLSAAVTPLFSQDLDSVKAEQNLDRRAEYALDHAHTMLDTARSLYKEAKYDRFEGAVLEIGDSVQVCHDALKATGKDPRKNAKQFKKVEQRIQLLIRRLRSMESEVSVDDRPVVKKVGARLEEINEEIVNGIFTKS